MPKSEEQRRADKAAYMRRKRAEHHAQMTLGDKCLLDRQIQTPTAEQREQMASQIAQANGIIITEKDNIQDLEQKFKDASMREPQPIVPTHPLADDPALLADAILNSYSKDFCNTNALLKHILAHLIRVEITLQDRLK